VGVTNSNGSSVCTTGCPLSSSTVAGAGLGRMPWSHWIVPQPQGRGPTATAATSSLWSARQGADGVDDGIERAHLVKVIAPAWSGARRLGSRRCEGRGG